MFYSSPPSLDYTVSTLCLMLNLCVNEELFIPQPELSVTVFILDNSHIFFIFISYMLLLIK